MGAQVRDPPRPPLLKVNRDSIQRQLLQGAAVLLADGQYSAVLPTYLFPPKGAFVDRGDSRQCQPTLATYETWFRPLGREDPWRKAWQPTPVLLPGESHGQRSLAGCRPWGRKESEGLKLLSTHTRTG